jgi:hypothetical protein
LTLFHHGLTSNERRTYSFSLSTLWDLVALVTASVVQDSPRLAFGGRRVDGLRRGRRGGNRVHQGHSPREYRPPRDGGARLGDQIFFIDDLVNAQGVDVGERSGFCTRVRELQGNDRFECQATYELDTPLPRGQVTTRGLFTLPPQAGQAARTAITGGTDAYAKARGQVTVTFEEAPAAPTARFRLELDIVL